MSTKDLGAVFFTDLDNTLIYSRRREIPGEKICVEYLDGREQSFMTRRTFDFLVSRVLPGIVPVTTRTEAQYRRLTCTDAMGVRFALVSCGGRLLADGAEDPDWTRETLLLAGRELPALERAAAMLKAMCGTNELHRPEPYMAYARCDDPAAACAALREAADPDAVAAAHDRRKVYLFCRSVNKGLAVRRFRARFGVGFAAAAGDDPLDVPMLCEADLALAAEGIYPLFGHSRKVSLPGEIISDAVCDALDGLGRKDGWI